MARARGEVSGRGAGERAGHPPAPPTSIRAGDAGQLRSRRPGPGGSRSHVSATAGLRRRHAVRPGRVGRGGVAQGTPPARVTGVVKQVRRRNVGNTVARQGRPGPPACRRPRAPGGPRLPRPGQQRPRPCDRHRLPPHPHPQAPPGRRPPTASSLSDGHRSSAASPISRTGRSSPSSAPTLPAPCPPAEPCSS